MYYKFPVIFCFARLVILFYIRVISHAPPAQAVAAVSLISLNLGADKISLKLTE